MSLRLLLPPSHGKADGGRRSPLDLDVLGFPELSPIRARLIGALVALAADEARCRAGLKISERQADEVARNAALRSGPTMPAVARYRGVLYDAIGVDTLEASARRRARSSILIASALFGVVRAGDPIPAYRLAAGDALDGLAGAWRTDLPAALRGGRGVIDLRSNVYVALAPLPRAMTVRVVRADGRSVSHDNKAYKGHLVRAFLTAPQAPRSVSELIGAAQAAGLRLAADDERVLTLTVE